MAEKSNKWWLINTALISGTAIIFGIFSQMYSAEEQIFITNGYFIQPKSQPFHFILMWFATIAVFLFALWLGRVIASFLWRKGLLFSVVGIFLLLGAAFLGYFSLVLKTNVESTRDFVTMGIIILFVGGLGAMMFLSSVFGKNK